MLDKIDFRPSLPKKTPCRGGSHLPENGVSPLSRFQKNGQKLVGGAPQALPLQGPVEEEEEDPTFLVQELAPRHLLCGRQPGGGASRARQGVCRLRPGAPRLTVLPLTIILPFPVDAGVSACTANYLPDTTGAIIVISHDFIFQNS